jgi:hypothetical protein
LGKVKSPNQTLSKATPMSEIVYRITTLLCQILAGVPVGTNQGLLHLLFALVSGRFLPSRGAVFAALADLGLSAPAVRRAEAALAYGRWQIADLIAAWQEALVQEKQVQPRSYGGYRPVPCDLVGFFRPRLCGHAGKHYTSQAAKALPAVVLGLSVSVVRIGKTRLAVPRMILRQEANDGGEAGLQKRLVEQTAKELADDEVVVVDAGFGLEHLLEQTGLRFVIRGRKNLTARRADLPAYQGRGARPKRGVRVRPLPRTYRGKTLPATPADRTLSWVHEGRHLEACVYENLVLSEAKPGAARFSCVVIRDPRYKEPLVLVSNLPVSAYHLWQLYRDRWPIEQLPLAAKQMLGAERSFVFGSESRFRLPELALLAGNLLSYVATTSQPVKSGFWDRCARPTCGRLRRVLSRVNSVDLPVPAGQIRKKASVTAHLLKGVRGHRRQPVVPQPLEPQQQAA